MDNLDVKNTTPEIKKKKSLNVLNNKFSIAEGKSSELEESQQKLF